MNQGMPQPQGTPSAACLSRRPSYSLSALTYQRTIPRLRRAANYRSHALHSPKTQGAWTRPALSAQFRRKRSPNVIKQSSRSRRHPFAATTQANSAEGSGLQPKTWEQRTQQLVAVSTLPFLLLMMPQVIKNASNFMAGNARALAALSWVGYSTAYFGNLLLLAYFVTKGEREAGLIQAIGVVSNATVLTQIWAAGYMPGTAFAGVVLLNMAALVITGLKVAGKLEAGRKRGKIWSAWHQSLGLFGVALLPQAVWATFARISTPLPACIAAAAGAGFLALDKAGRLPAALQGHWASVPGWTATLLFMFQPLAQALSNFSGTSDLTGVSVGTLLLGMMGNGLMIPRALVMRDAVWSTGSIWGTLLSWTQLLSLFIRHTASGQRYFAGWAFAVTSVLLALYLAAIAFKDAEARRPHMTKGGLQDPTSLLQS